MKTARDQQPACIATVHGIQSTAENWGDIYRRWLQRTCSVSSVSSVANHPVVVENIDWGRITGLQMYIQLALPWLERRRERFVADELASFATEYRCPIHVIAHSKGCDLIVDALYRFPRIQIQALVLVGSVLPIRYRYSQLDAVVDRGQVTRVLNVWSPNDSIIETWSIWPYGKSGSRGLADIPAVAPIYQQQTQEDHNTYFWSEFRDQHFTTWTEFALNPVIDQALIPR